VKTLLKKKPVSTGLDSTELSNLVVKGMQDKKAIDIVVMDLRGIKHAVADYFVICSGNSDTQIDAIADSIEEALNKAHNLKPWKREGRQNREWVLIDFVDVVAHVFSKEKRIFYGLEDLWGDAKTVRVADGN
jgi:ribosome-associated protein